MSDSFKYAAFISYSHANEAWSKWLHKRLEAYRVPARLAGKSGAYGVVPRRIGVCFRDQVELSAASHLGETLKQSLRDSKALIVVCSPHSAKSNWVNEEVKYFRRLGRGDFIYTLIVDGEPNAQNPAQECFPPALILDDDGEPLQVPLAADARPGRDGRTEGFLKLAAGLLGVGFGELRRRELRRRARLATFTISAALSIAAITSGLAITAYRARNEAQLRRQQADDLIDFMLGDLKDRLAKVGRLDVLDAATDKVMQYVQKSNEEAVSPTLLAQQTKAFISVADIRDSRGQLPEAQAAGRAALETARKLIAQNPHSDDAEFLLASALQILSVTYGSTNDIPVASFLDEALSISHRQRAAYPDEKRWLSLEAQLQGDGGIALYRKGDYEQALPYLQACTELLSSLAEAGNSPPGDVHQFWSCRTTTALVFEEENRVQDAVGVYQELVRKFPQAMADRADDLALRNLFVPSLMSGSRTFIKAGLLAQADYAATQAADLCRQLVAHDPVNADYRNQCGSALFALGKTKQRMEDWREASTVYLEAQQMLKQALIDTPDSLQDREFLIAAYTSEAQVILQSNGDLKASIEQDESAEKVGDGISDVYVQLGVLSAHLQAWETGQFLELKRVLPEHEAAKQLIVSLSTPDNLASEYISSRLKAARMHLAYSDGDTAIGDELYSDLRDRHYHDIEAVTRIRKRLCARHSVLHHQHCAAIEEWKPPVKPSWVTPSG